METDSITDTTSQPAADAQQDQTGGQPQVDTQPLPESPQQVGDKPENQAGISTEPKKKNKDRNKLGSRRGVETLFRVNYDNHIQLSQLADGKANMLISINGLIISVLIALIAPRITAVDWTMLPVLILLIGCMISLSFAVISARPRLNQTRTTLEEVRRNQGNILFFGQFTRLSLTEFEQGMHDILLDRQLLYDNMIRDIYSMGRVLKKKYYYLQFAYAAFLFTLVVAVISFLLVILSAGTE